MRLSFFDRLVQQHVFVFNPAAPIKGVKEEVIEGTMSEDAPFLRGASAFIPEKTASRSTEFGSWPYTIEKGLRQRRSPHPMSHERPDYSEMTLRRFCRWKRIPLDDTQRSLIGMGLSKRAAQRQIPRRKVKEPPDSGFWSRSRVYPRAFLDEWLKEYRAGVRGDQAAAVTGTRADTRSSSEPDSAVLAQCDRRQPDGQGETEGGAC